MMAKKGPQLSDGHLGINKIGVILVKVFATRKYLAEISIATSRRSGSPQTNSFSTSKSLIFPVNFKISCVQQNPRPHDSSWHFSPAFQF